MIVVRIELWPGGDKTRKQDLATVVISNDGSGTDRVANYKAVVSHQAGTQYAGSLDPAELITGARAWKRGQLVGFRRDRGAVMLLKAALEVLFR